ncbi:adrenocortical dysplasia protein homolog [Narcine bancroftii]|uniref:adrenocortical dysplasia protein homolog n=1 Tax=Narcine bancroftii TaxID=1343680 RepID=UPI003831E093
MPRNMAFCLARVCSPWIAEMLLEQENARSWGRSAPIQVTELLPIENWIKEAGYASAVVVYVSDVKYRIKAVLTEEAGNNLQQEEENYTLSQLKNKVVILKKFNIQARLELELKDCEFYLVVQDLKILPGDMGFLDTRSCNTDLAVKKKLKDLWESYLNNMIMQEKTFTDLHLSNIINAVAEDEIKLLKETAELCLDPDVSSSVSASASPLLLPSVNQTSGWKAMIRQNKNKRDIFTVPEAMLIISSHQEKVLNNIKEWKDDFVCTEDPRSENSGCTDEFMCIEEQQEIPSSQDPWNLVLPVSLGRIPSSGETCISCTYTSESCKQHDGICHTLCSTFVDAPSCRQAVELGLPDSSMQNDPDKSLELYTDESEAQCAHGSLYSPTTSNNSIHEAELEEDAREKSVLSGRSAYKRGFKNISPLSGTTVNSSGLNCMDSFRSLLPVSAVKDGGQCRPNMTVCNHTTVARNTKLVTQEEQFNNNRDKECYDIPRVGKRKRKLVNAEDRLDGNCDHQGTSWMLSRSDIEEKNARSSSSDGTFIETDHCEAMADEVCQMNIVTGHEESYQKEERRMKKMLKDSDLNNLSGNKMTVLSTKYNQLDFVSNRSSQRVQNCNLQTPGVDPIGQETEDVWMQVSHQRHGNLNKDESPRHPDGSRFLFNYPAPSAELIAQVKAVRVSSDLLKWAVSYLSGPRLAQD